MSSPANPTLHVPTWLEIRQLADELQVKMNLAGKELRDRWDALRPRLAALEHKVGAAGDRASQIVSAELTDLGTAIKKMIDDLDPRGE